MPIPDFESIMLPLLSLVRDEKEYSKREAVEILAQKFKLTEDDLKELQPSGQQAVFDNRVAWAKVYLGKAGLLESTRRGFFKITPRGLQVLKQNPAFINIKLLDQYPEFQEFRKVKKEDKRNLNTEIEKTVTPGDLLESGYLKIRQDLIQDLLSQIKSCSPAFFEKRVVQLLVEMGYGGSRKDAGQAIGRTGDEGIDGIIKEDKLGLDTIYIQAKRWQGVVGRPEIQKFVGALQGQRARKGIFITTSDFSKEAAQYASSIDCKVVLMDGEQLAQWMIDLDLGVAKTASYDIKKIDIDYFVED